MGFHENYAVLPETFDGFHDGYLQIVRVKISNSDTALKQSCDLQLNPKTMNARILNSLCYK
jgi:hypothetical protein